MTKLDELIEAARKERDIANAKAGFDHGWEAALDEAIVIAETVVFKDGSAKDVVLALREFVRANG